jgi:threonine synthase
MLPDFVRMLRDRPYPQSRYLGGSNRAIIVFTNAKAMNQLRCTNCNFVSPLSEPIWRCPRCGSVLDLDFTPSFDLIKINGRPHNLWRYREAIPIERNPSIVTFDEGFTPLLEVLFRGRPVWVKQDYLFPTGSYKDRGATVLVSKMNELGVQRCVEDSSGNAGCAVAAYCAKASIACDIYVPKETALAKLAQIQLYGARLVRVPGSREDTAAAVMEAAQSQYYASHSWNPFFFQGTKTFAYEVCEQLGWRAPDTVILPVGNGTLLLGSQIGFGELARAGIIGHEPRLVAVQSEACAPLAQAWSQNQDDIPAIQKKETLAEGIAIAAPIRGRQIVQAVRRSGGEFITVSDAEVKTALKSLCGRGYYIEPTSAAAAAGVEKYLAAHPRDELVVSVFTGSGLKTTEKMLALLESRPEK